MLKDLEGLEDLNKGSTLNSVINMEKYLKKNSRNSAQTTILHCSDTSAVDNRDTSHIDLSLIFLRSKPESSIKVVSTLVEHPVSHYNFPLLVLGANATQSPRRVSYFRTAAPEKRTAPNK